MNKTIALVATCDTKGTEIEYIKKNIECYKNLKTLVIDTGILGDPIRIKPDISKYKVASVAGTSINNLIALGSKGQAVEIMKKGVYLITKKLYEEGKIQALLAIGGAEGAQIAGFAMEALPLGFPKLIITPIASGNFKFNMIIHHKDSMVMHSVIDILGINSISKIIFDNGVRAIIGMLYFKKNNEKKKNRKKKIAITMLGIVTKPVMDIIKPRLEKLGYEVIIFHANGTGGDCMDELVKKNYFNGVIEYATNEIVANRFGGLLKCRDERMEAAITLNIPTIITPGAANCWITEGKWEELREKYKDRKIYRHNPEAILIRLTKEELSLIGEDFAKKLNKSMGNNVKFVYPKRGFFCEDKKGLSMWDPESNKAFLDTLKLNLRGDIEIVEVNSNIMDSEFAIKVVDELIAIMN